MPGLDGRGPAGRGPMTGAARGYCILPVATRQAPERSPYSGYMMSCVRRLFEVPRLGLGLRRGFAVDAGALTGDLS